MTPLMHAASHGYTESVRLLLDAGAPWNSLDSLGLRAGDIVTEGSQQETVELLVGFAVQAELILGTITRSKRNESDADSSYLDERVAFGEDRYGCIRFSAVRIPICPLLMEMRISHQR
jgi:type IV protein arginine methyltransferase